LGDLSAASLRGVWGVGVDVDRSSLGPHLLASLVKRVDRALDYAVRSFLEGSLVDDSIEIGIERDAVGIVGISPQAVS
jgi:basic membrane lipoprotein Med (substrate-binding protein (PBP1-ABC) superfamily)